MSSGGVKVTKKLGEKVHLITRDRKSDKIEHDPSRFVFCFV